MPPGLHLLLVAAALVFQEVPRPTWTAVVPTSMTSEGGATLELSSDGNSVLASGELPDHDVHVIEGIVELTRITGMRLEVLPDPSLPKNGPGRNASGHFFLGEIAVEEGSKFNSKKLKPVRLVNLSASHSPGGHPPAFAADGNEATGWAIHPQVGKRNILVAEFEEEIDRRGTQMRFRLSFSHKVKESLGHYRISVTGADRPFPSQVPDYKKWPEVQGKINDAVQRGVSYLLDQQGRDGTWHQHQPRYPNGQTALSVYTLLKCGVRKDHPALIRALAFLRARQPVRTYSSACQIMALCQVADQGDRKRLERTVQDLIDWQKRDGGYGYPDGGGDLSCTQYAAMGLRTAALNGYEVPDAVWLGLKKRALAYQDEPRGPYGPAGFSYGKNPPFTSSMTAAGVCVLAICDEQLKQKRASTVAQQKRGIDWLVQHFSVTTNVKSNGKSDANPYYYLYGLERVAGVLGIDKIGPHDWYRAGAGQLVKSQKKDGSWNNASDTCFALLFLTRATSSVTGGVSRKADSYGEDDLKADVSLRATGDTPLTVWLSSFGEAAKADYAWPEEAGGGLRIREVRYLQSDIEGLGDAVVMEAVPGDPSRPTANSRYAIQYRFPRSGKFWVWAEVVLADPDGDGPDIEPLVIDSLPIEVRIREVLDPKTLRHAEDMTRNLFLKHQIGVRKSTEVGGRGPTLAFDGLLGSAWMFTPEDKDPWLYLEFTGKPVRAKRLLISQLAGAGEQFGLVTKLSVMVNGKKPAYEVTVAKDPLVKTEFVFGKTLRVKSLKVEVTEWTPGSNEKLTASIAELELQ